MPITLHDKVLYSALSAVILLITTNAFTYKFVDKLFDSEEIIYSNGCPTVIGHFVLSLIFFLLIFITMILISAYKKNGSKKSTWLFIKYSFFATLLFFIITNTEIYKLIGMITNNKSASVNGCPTVFGLFLHALIYFLIILGIMSLPKNL